MVIKVKLIKMLMALAILIQAKSGTGGVICDCSGDWCCGCAANLDIGQVLEVVPYGLQNPKLWVFLTVC